MSRAKSKKYKKYKKLLSGTHGKTRNYFNNPKESKLEITFENGILRPVCSTYGLEYEKQFKIKTKFYDFYIPKIHLIVEVDGTYWHGKKRNSKGKLNEMQIRNIKNDRYKNKLAINSGYNIIRFWEDDIKEAKNSVMSSLNTKVKKLLK